MKTRPYIIVTPTYCVSAGVRVLHTLCHELNSLGFDAKLLLTSNLSPSPDQILNPEFNTPYINNELHEQWESINSEAIVIYADGIPGNPFGAKRVVRYILGKEYQPSDPADEYKVYYSKAFQLNRAGKYRNLFLFPIDLGIFNDKNAPPRSQDMLWLGKGAQFCTERPLDCIPITYNWPETRKELAENLRKTRYLYSYDAVSAINLEAILCGAVVIIKHSSYHDRAWTRQDQEHSEVGTGGYAYGDSDFEIDRAIRTRDEMVNNIRYCIATFRLQLLEFVDATQQHFRL